MRVNARHGDLDPDAVVVVPVAPAPLVRLRDLERGRDEIDDVVDELFGAPDDRGPGPVDAALLIGGVGAVVAGVAADQPTIVTVGGVIAALLGSILPIRALSTKIGARRRSARLRSIIGGGAPLRTDHPSVERLLAAHAELLSASTALELPARGRVEKVAHSAVLEVASLLDGRSPTTAGESEYIELRAQALADLARTVADPRVGDGESEHRRAVVEARQEVEQLAGGSSVTDAADLSRDLLGRDES